MCQRGRLRELLSWVLLYLKLFTSAHGLKEIISFALGDGYFVEPLRHVLLVPLGLFGHQQAVVPPGRSDLSAGGEEVAGDAEAGIVGWVGERQIELAGALIVAVGIELDGRRS